VIIVSKCDNAVTHKKDPRTNQALFTVIVTESTETSGHAYSVQN